MLTHLPRVGIGTNDIFMEDDKHYVTIIMRADYVAGEATVLEPEKCLEWQWFDWHELPVPLFLPIQHMQQQGFEL